MHPGKALVTGAIVGSGLWLFGTPALSALGIFVGAFLLSGGWKFMKLLFQTFPRDFRYKEQSTYCNAHIVGISIIAMYCYNVIVKSRLNPSFTCLNTQTVQHLSEFIKDFSPVCMILLDFYVFIKYISNTLPSWLNHTYNTIFTVHSTYQNC